MSSDKTEDTYTLIARAVRNHLEDVPNWQKNGLLVEISEILQAKEVRQSRSNSDTLKTLENQLEEHDADLDRLDGISVKTQDRIANLESRMTYVQHEIDINYNRLTSNSEKLEVIDEALLSQEERLNKTVKWTKGAEERLRELEKLVYKTGDVL